jgi:membrane protein implicated in regulation of membrane protease activity
MPWLRRHVDKVLTLLFAAIIIGVPLLLQPHPHETWKSTLISSVLVILLYLLFASQIKRWERDVRRQAIAEMRQMLRDVVNNKLSVIMINASLAQPLSDDDAKKLQSVMETVQKISEDLENLSEDTLTNWRTKYADITSDKSHP